MNMNKKTIEDVNVDGKRVLVRVDFNVPLDKERNITDDTRIRAAMPTIRYLIDKGAKVILCSHLGRPKGKVDPALSLRPVAEYLKQLLPEKNVMFVDDCIGEKVKAAADSMKNGDVLLLENVRFYKQETDNDPEFAGQLALLADLFVQEAFGTAHRAHASTAGVAAYLPAVAGYLIEKELRIMGGALENPVRPFVAVLGGAKVGDKIGVIRNLLGICDTLLIGGGMAYTFYKAMGRNIGTSILDEDSVAVAIELMALAKERNVTMMLPEDNIVSKEFSADSEYKQVPADQFPDDWMGMDIGEKTAKKYADVIKETKTVVWNGPMGAFEMEPFSHGTYAVAKACAENQGVTIIGGGDSAAAVNQMKLDDQITHISTGGGASLEFLEGLELPGVAVLNDK